MMDVFLRLEWRGIGRFSFYRGLRIFWGRSRVGATALAVMIGFVLSVSAASARQYVDMGVKDDAAVYQPLVTIEVLTNDVAETSLGPGVDIGGLGIFGNSLLLDTGASSIIVMNDAETELRRNGYVTEGEVFEQGVAGFSLLEVSAEYKLTIAGDDGVEYQLSDTRLQSGQFPALVGFNGLVGMPGMVGRNVSMEIFPATGGGDIFDLIPNAEVTFPTTIPASTGHRYSVPLTAKSFNLTEEDTIGPGGGPGPLPIQAPLPMLSPTLGFEGRHASGQFILDTGAQISFISPKIALSLGLDSNGDGEFTTADDQSFGSLPIGGIGGTVDAPFFLIDTFRLHTNEDIDLVWDSAQVLVLDIHPDIDGVVGSDLLTSGWVDLFSATEGTGPIKKVSIDFSQFFAEGDTGELLLDLDADFDTVQTSAREGDHNIDGSTDAHDLVHWAAGFGTELGARLADGDGDVDGRVDGGDFLRWQRAFGEGLAGDFGGNGLVDEADLADWQAGFGPAGHTGENFLTWQRNYGTGEGPLPVAGVPEPHALVLLLVGIGVIGGRSRMERLSCGCCGRLTYSARSVRSVDMA